MNLALPVLLLSSALALGCQGGGAGGGRIDTGTGVAECDAYVAKMSACSTKLPAEERPAHNLAIATARDRFEERAETDEGKLALKATCQQMAEALAERSVCN